MMIFLFSWKELDYLFIRLGSLISLFYKVCHLSIGTVVVDDLLAVCTDPRGLLNVKRKHLEKLNVYQYITG